MLDYTRKFQINQEREKEIKDILSSVYVSLQEKGYNPVNQIVGYILSEDPTYITNHNNARSLIRRIDRNELLQTLVRSYLTTPSRRRKRFVPYENEAIFYLQTRDFCLDRDTRTLS